MKRHVPKARRFGGIQHPDAGNALFTGAAAGPGYPLEPRESLETLLTRDLEAWIAAKAAIERVRRAG